MRIIPFDEFRATNASCDTCLVEESERKLCNESCVLCYQNGIREQIRAACEHGSNRMSKPNWLTIAELELDVHEVPGAKAEPRIIEYHSHTTLKATSDEVPWCSAFVNFCMDTAGYPGTHSAAARSWLTWGKAIDTPVQGCIVVMSRGNNPAQGHVGFYDRENPHGLVRVLAGNQHDRVCYSWLPKKNILAYRMPE